jgi:hypothetical protein
MRSHLLQVAVVVLALVVSGPVQAAETRDHPRSGAAIAIGVHGDRVSLNAVDQPWSRVLWELERATGTVVRVDRLPEGTVTVGVQDQPMATAIERLFGPGTQFVILYDGTRSHAALPSEVWVLRPGHRGGDVRVPAPRVSAPRTTDAGDVRVRLDRAIRLGASGDATALAPLLSDTDVEVRGAAVTSLVGIGSAEAVAAAMDALRDADHGVRLRAVRAVTNLGGPLAVEFLREAATNDAAEVRRLAARELAELYGAR